MSRSQLWTGVLGSRRVTQAVPWPPPLLCFWCHGIRLSARQEYFSGWRSVAVEIERQKNCSVRSAHVYFTSRVIRERRMTWFAQQWTYPQVNRIINEWSTSSATSLSCFTHESLALSLRGRKSGLESAVGGMAVHPKRSFLVSGWLPRKCLLIEQGQEFWPPPYIVIHRAIR